MRVLGLMSGTSADGIDVALARISGAHPHLYAKCEAYHRHPYAAPIRQAILRLANGAPTTTAEISQLNFLLGEEFAAAAISACRRWRIPRRKIPLIGSHGQTIYHQGQPTKFVAAARPIASTLQIAEPSIIAARTGITTIADFRPADMAAGGQGAPLVPFVDSVLYRHEHRGRVALNIGGIANVTVISRAAKPESVFAFDTGPGNMLIDALVERITKNRVRYDRAAHIALQGREIPALLDRLMRHPYLRLPPPKTAGREQFGKNLADDLFAFAKRRRIRPEDLVRSATTFTALSIASAFRQFIFSKAQIDDLIVAGGGTKNPLIIAQLASALPGIAIIPSTRFGVPTEAKEAFAFAILAYEAYHGRANNLPSATGAERITSMGKLVRGSSK